ncbi:hypothetical protein KP79_PYT00712 [Mizuhopecten yessoensis]|uniref:Ig-like domain-containing protein n=1 Tax=Mizuhopecten yessoensis TaxID=6573 RepID=A0A210QSB7_MIZYE|nr:hypothetical protein KP79_PYT00712 [Mizuhopecten yessoensis]
MTITGPDEVKYQETLTLTCTTPDPALLPLTWFSMGYRSRDMVQVEPDAGRWKHRTTITTLTTPDNVTSSVLQIEDCSIQDESKYECRSRVQEDINTTISARHFVSVPNAFAVTGPDEVKFQENLTLTCTAPYPSMLPLTWFLVVNGTNVKIEPDQGRWKYRTTITITTNPDHATLSVLQIEYCSNQDGSMYECRTSVQKDTNTSTSALHNVSVSYGNIKNKVNEFRGRIGGFDIFRAIRL